MRKLKFEYKITAIYLLIGCLWILFSDKLLFLFFKESSVLTKMQTYKGWFYVVTTAVLFYFFLKEHLVKIRNAERKAIENDRLKTAFIQNISHEIRTPMNGIIGFAGLLQNDNLSKSQKDQYLEIITKSSEQLLKIVNEVLEISLIESGCMNLNEEQLSLNRLMDEIHKYFSPTIKKEIEFTLEKGLPHNEIIILADEFKLRQTLNNLIHNAVKFTYKGRISFGYLIKDKSIEFYVKDTGIGIKNEDYDKVFDRFFQSETNIEKVYEGVGLGLAICKGNITLMQGTIWLQSKVSEGSEFHFTIPYKPVNLQETIDTGKLTDTENLSKMTILVVEDEETNFLYIKELFIGTVVELLNAENGSEAVEICKNNPDIDLILMDIKMPVMNGYDATRQIREIYPDLPIIAQSAFALRDERQKAIDAGCTDYIAKPFKRQALMEMLKYYNSMSIYKK